MTTHTYRKEIVSNPFYANGAKVPFEVLEGNRGVIAIDDSSPANQKLIDVLDEASDNGRGGVIKISAHEYFDLKKKFPYDPSKRKLLPNEIPLRVAQTQAPRAADPVAAGASPVAPISAPLPEPPSPLSKHLGDKLGAKSRQPPPIGKASRVRSQPQPS
jgi:hypothetical protein